tara:strand:+ start:50 stop:358 length:309 start_codon:yes stop_codon:yes gene_type:complete
MVKKKNTMIKYEGLKTHLTEQENIKLLELSNSIKEIICDIRECGIKSLSFYDIEKLEEKAEIFRDIMRFKYIKNKDSQWANTYADLVLPTNNKAWYSESEEE